MGDSFRMNNNRPRLNYTGNFSPLVNQDRQPQVENNKHSDQRAKQHYFSCKNPEASTPLENSINVLQCSSSKQVFGERIKPDIKQSSSPETSYHDQNATNSSSTGSQPVESEFSLRLASEFPELNSLKKQKKGFKNAGSSRTKSNPPEGETIVQTKRTEKSWKPKVKDPIFINIDQALQSLPEKNKLEKKSTPLQNIPLPANILDSDKPVQRRGKVRPDKPKKPTKLKEHILSARNERVKNNGEVNVLSTELNVNGGLDDRNEVETEVKPCEVERHLKVDLESQSEQYSCQIKQSIHSRKFREYCTNCITVEIVTHVCELLEKVAQFQDRTFTQNPVKANAKRRYVAGIHQTNKYLAVKKVKLLLIAPDMEKSPGEGGLDEKVRRMVEECASQEIPCVFGPNRKRLGRSVRKNALVACVAVLSFEGAEEQFTKVMEALHDAKIKYESLTNQSNYQSPEQDEETELVGGDGDDEVKNDVTSTLLEKLKDLSPRDKLLRAINPRDW